MFARGMPVEKQGRFRLSAGEAELAPIARQTPVGVIRAQRLQALGDVGFVEPFDLVALAAAHDAQAVGRHELDGARTVFTDVGDESEDVAGRHLELRVRALFSKRDTSCAFHQAYSEQPSCRRAWSPSLMSDHHTIIRDAHNLRSENSPDERLHRPRMCTGRVRWLMCRPERSEGPHRRLQPA